MSSHLSLGICLWEHNNAPHTHTGVPLLTPGTGGYVRLHGFKVATQLALNEGDYPRSATVGSQGSTKGRGAE